jgi:oxygen-independent coproporphyrinogen-3 oxidase
MQEKGRALLSQRGFKQYEISAYSCLNARCQHNENYWKFGDYLGIGAGAHSKITDSTTQTITRLWKVKNPKDYLNEKQTFIGGKTIISKKELPFEFMLNALRLYEEIPVNLFTERTGLTLASIEKPLNVAQNRELLTWDARAICLTQHGQNFYNDLVALFL